LIDFQTLTRIAQALLLLGIKAALCSQQLIEVKTCALCLPSNSARLPRMTEELIRNIRVIHDLERAIRVWELVRDSTQQVVNETTACYEKQGCSVETNPTVAKLRVDIATYNTAILGAKARIDDLERGNQTGG
jgi:hypothetical protein